VLWYGVADPHGAMATLATDLHDALGVELKAPYRPHLTLARARRAPVPATAWLAETAMPAGELLVDRVELLRSHLGAGPARYERLASASLAVPAHV